MLHGRSRFPGGRIFGSGAGDFRCGAGARGRWKAQMRLVHQDRMQRYETSLHAFEASFEEVLMRKHFFVGPNKQLKSGMSIKVWKIERRDRRVQVWWGRARLDQSKRRVRSKGTLTTRWWDFSTSSVVEDQMWLRIHSKVLTGYKRNLRRRSR